MTAEASSGGPRDPASAGAAPGGTGAPGGGFHQSWTRTLVEIGALLAVVALLVLGVRGCAGCTAATLVAQLPPSADMAIGKAGAESMRAQYGATGERPTADQQARSERIFGEIRAALTPEEARILVEPRLTVVVDEQVNAFALPGGEVFVLTGLLERTKDDDDQLRGVLAHEIGHAVHRHGVRSLVRNGIYGLMVTALLGSGEDLVTALVAGASQLDHLQYSRAMESEADTFAVDVLHRAGKSPEGLARFLESLGAQPVPQLLSTHPDSAERAKAIRGR